MNVPLLIAGSLALVGAAVHGGAGEALVVRKLSTRTLASSPFGGPGMTKLMIRATWHITTAAFATVGVTLLLCGSVLEGDSAHAAGVVAAAAQTSFAAIVLVGSLANPRALLRHPGPLGLTAVAVLAWIGVS